MSDCANHAVPATASCARCAAPCCDRCAQLTLDGTLCPRCAAAARARRSRRTALAIGAVVAVSVGLAVIAFASVGGANEVAPGSAPGEAGSGERDDYVDSLRQRRDRAPCDRELVLKLVNEQNKQRRHTEALVDVGRFEAACGASFFQLQRATVYALQQLGRSADAVTLESAMLVTDPRSSDLWWWRADDRAKAGQPLAALADLRQTFALARSASYSRYAAGLALDIAGAARRPCEAVFALDLFVAVQHGALVERTERKVRALDASERCADRLGRGSASLSLGRTFKVTVGGVAGRFTVDRQAGTTVLAATFAQRAGVVARGESTETLLDSRLVPGVLGTADLAIGDAIAPDVAVVISSELPPETDGVLGLSALWLFEVQMAEDGSLSLSGTSGS